MTVSNDGANLIFLVSQPRSGSTLLQKILGKHSEIATSVEPWLLLPLVFSMKGEHGRSASYDLNNHIDTLQFLKSLPEGETLYANGISEMMSRIYNAALGEHKKIFLDKTPRYYLIIPELARLFPEARFIFLFRNPLAVLASVHSTWGGFGGLLNSSARLDLLSAPELLVQGRADLGDRGITIQYEALVNDTAAEMKRLCEWLSVSFEDSMVEYGEGAGAKWPLGDQGTVYEHGRPSQGSIDKWREFITQTQNWRYAQDYIDLLGPARVEDLGYSYNFLKGVLDENKPPLYRRMLTWPLVTGMNIYNVIRRIYRRYRYQEPIF